jgi:hypothetical protein
MEEQIMLIIPSDSQIREDVLREFRQIACLRDTRIAVEVNASSRSLAPLAQLTVPLRGWLLKKRPKVPGMLLPW